MRRSPSAGALRFALYIAGTVALLWLADLVLQPVPAPAGGVAVGGVLATSLARRARWRWVAGGVALGLAAGVVYHLYVHASGDSPAPSEGLFAHLVIDGLEGLAVGLVVLFLMLVGMRFLEVVIGQPKTETAKARSPRP